MGDIRVAKAGAPLPSKPSLSNPTCHFSLKTGLLAAAGLAATAGLPGFGNDHPQPKAPINEPPQVLTQRNQAQNLQALQAQTLTRLETEEVQRILKDNKVWEKSLHFFDAARLADSGLYLDRIPVEGLTPGNRASYPTVSLAATGYGLAMDVLKAERGEFGTSKSQRKQAVTERLNQALDSAEKLSKAENGYFLPHFVHATTHQNLAEISTVDTMLFYLGAMASSRYAGPEAEARVTQMFQKLDFEAMRTRGNNPTYQHANTISHGLTKEGQYIPSHWGGPFSEGALLVNLMALGSNQNVPAQVYTHGWERGLQWQNGSLKSFNPSPLFTYFYPLGFINLEGLRDGQGTDFVAAARNAVLLQQAYCKEKGYPPKLFGLSACDAPPPFGYRAYAPNPHEEDGTIAPPAVLASLPLAPKATLEALRELAKQGLLKGNMGPVNAFHTPSGWQTKDALAIDIGSMLLMLDAHENKTIQNLMAEHPIIQTALSRAGFRKA